MAIDDISATLSVFATGVSLFTADLQKYASGDNDVLTAPDLVRDVGKFRKLIADVRKALDDVCRTSRESVRTPVDDQTAVRLTHLVADLGDLDERLDRLHLAVEFYETDLGEGRSFVGAREGIVAAVAFARGDLQVLERRLRALAKFYESPFLHPGDLLGSGDGAIEEALVHLDAERAGDVLHMSGADERVPPPAAQESRSPATRCTLIPVLFATDRTIRSDVDPLHLDFDARSPGERLTWGVAEVSIPRGARHHLGRLERPSLWKFQFREDPERHVCIVTAEARELSSWVALARERLATAGKRAALVFIHGFNVSFADAIRRTGQIGWDLQFDGVVAAFSWCSVGHLRSYLADERNARLAAPRLLELLAVLRAQAGAEEIHVIAHSMGNLVLLEALRDRAENAPPLSEVVFAAPDYDAEEFKRVIRGLKGRARRYTLYGSAEDNALEASKALRNDYPRAGDGGEHVLVTDGVETVDATEIGRDLLGLGHAYFSSDRTVLTDLYYVIREPLPASRRSGLRPATAAGLPYWIFAP